MKTGALWAIVLGILVGAVPAAWAAASGDGIELVPRTVETTEYPTVHLYAELRGVAFGTDVDVAVAENGDEFHGATVTWLDESEVPAHDVILVIDTSGSMGGAGIAGARQAALVLLERMSPSTRIAVVEFATEGRVVAPLSTDRSQIRAAITSLTASGSTALHDGVMLAVDLVDDARELRDSHATIIVLADGEDNASLHSEADVLARITGEQVTVHAVELRTSASDLAVLGRIAAGSDGGTATTALSASDLVERFGALDVAGSSRLRITYESQAHGHATLAVKVATSNGEATYEPWRVVLPSVGDDPSSMTAAPIGMRGLVTAAPGRWMLLAGWILAVVALFALVVAAVPARPRVDLGRLGFGQGSRISGAVDRVLGAAQEGLERGGRLAALADALEGAGIKMSPGRYIVNVVAWTVLAGLGGLLMQGPVLAALASVAVAGAARAVFKIRTARRRAAFADQLDDTLMLLAGSLRAGHSLMQAIDTVAREAQAPTAGEFRRVINATRLGQDLTDAFRDVVDRMGSQDLDWVTQAMAIHREVGGNLAGVLDAVAETIRERNQIRRQIKALSAEGRLSAIVLMSLPVGILAFLAVTNPDHVAAFTTTLLGMIMLASALVLLTVGGLWLRQIVKVRF